MKPTSSFALAQLGDVLRNVLALPATTELECSLDDNGESSTILTVKAQGVCEEYLLLKSALNTTANGDNNPWLVQPAFIVQDNEGETYGAFNKERLHNFVPPERNNLNDLKVILRTLAQYQAASEDNEANSEYSLKDITDKIASLDYFKSIGKITVTLEEVQVAFSGLLKSKFLVKSIWSLTDNVYVNKESNASLFLQISPMQSVPPAYDALLYIFSLSDEQFRQKHFENLVSFYFKSLREALDTQHSSLREQVTKKYEELQLKTLLPVVKLRYATALAETSTSSSQFNDILANVSNYLEYPLIQQEDVYQVVKNKLASSDYKLLSHKLVPLSEKNGHLGEYFHLIISVEFKDKEETLNLFAKYLTDTNDMTKDIIESGIGDKEDFFYTTLYSLFQENHIESLFDFAPKCYLSKLSELTILDDLGFLGYTSLKPNALLDKDGMQAVLKQAAKLHASSIILEELLSKQTGRVFRFGDEHSKCLEEFLFIYDGPGRSWFDGSIDSLWWIMEKFPDLTNNSGLSPEELKEKLKNVILSVFSKVKRSDTLRNVINHGDMYIANMLFKFGKDKAIEDAILIDFQLTSCPKETKDKHYTTLLDDYYETFSTYLKNFNLHPNEIYSRKQFDDDVNYAKSAALAMAFCYRHLNHMDPTFREEMTHDNEKYKYFMEDHKEELMEMLWKEEGYRVLLRGFMEDFIDVIKSGF